AGSPVRARRQPTAFEFHWGKPPPAADPSTTTLMGPQPAPSGSLPGGAGVGVDLGPDRDLDDAGLFPAHVFLRGKEYRQNRRRRDPRQSTGAPTAPRHIAPAALGRVERPMIFSLYDVHPDIGRIEVLDIGALD